ncbi:unnamed protein product [Brachionus calyciflorus]|uniref:Uncharacterized protein n=1 Tax=Brachionus calyciflorus TaxID=104777 RepID=A0A813MGS6_9BILA|nr:unnamed protein product [Brachionus calyciflorus]
METLFESYSKLLCMKKYEEKLVEDLEKIVKKPWNIYKEEEITDDEVEKLNNVINQETNENPDSPPIELQEVDDILKKAEELISQLNISKNTTENKNPRVVVPKPITKTNEKKEIKNTSNNKIKVQTKPIQSQKKALPVYMQAPFKTEQKINNFKRSSSTTVLPKSQLNEKKLTIEPKPSSSSEHKIQNREILSKSEINVFKTKTKKTKIVKNFLSFKEMAPSLTLPTKFSNLISINRKLNNQIENELNRNMVYKKNSFLVKLEENYFDKNNSGIVENLNCILLREKMKKSNIFFEEFLVDLNKKIDHEDNLILLLNIKLFYRKYMDFKNALRSLYENEDTISCEDIKDDREISNFVSSQIYYSNIQDLKINLDLKIRILELEFKIGLFEYLIDNFLNREFDEINSLNKYEENQESFFKFLNILFGFFMNKSTVFVK